MLKYLLSNVVKTSTTKINNYATDYKTKFLIELYMSEYKRPNFDAKWWEKVRTYIENNPEGFESDEVKQFMKYVVNRYMEQNELKEELRKQILEEMD